MDDEYAITKFRPDWIFKLLKKYPELGDLNIRDPDEKEITGCFFGSILPKYDKNETTYHPHDFRIRTKGKNLHVCKEHLKLLSTLSKELSAVV